VTTTDRTNERRSEPGLDLYRALVVLMMFVVHANRLQAPRGVGPVESALAFFMWTEPYIAASFLFIAGVSLELARAQKGRRFLSAALPRAAWLYALAIGLFVPQFGLELPDLLLSPGILSAIGVAVALGALSLASPWPDRALGVLAVSVLAVTAFLDGTGATVSGLNAGPGGAFPLVAFTAAGALTARALAAGRHAALGVATGLGVAILVTLVITDADWITQRSSMYRRHDGQLALLELFRDAPRAPVPFWNHSALGALGLAAPLTVSLLALLALGRRLGSPRALAPLLVLGRHALAAYVLHLGLLGVVELFGLSPRTASGTWVLILAIAVSTTAAGVARRPGGPNLNTSCTRTRSELPPRGLTRPGRVP
jgi:uncharacterized membrane protein